MKSKSKAPAAAPQAPTTTPVAPSTTPIVRESQGEMAAKAETAESNPSANLLAGTSPEDEEKRRLGLLSGTA
jgi:hypothetical protein